GEFFVRTARAAAAAIGSPVTSSPVNTMPTCRERAHRRTAIALLRGRGRTSESDRSLASANSLRCCPRFFAGHSRFGTCSFRILARRSLVAARARARGAGVEGPLGLDGGQITQMASMRRRGQIGDAEWARWEHELVAAGREGRIRGALNNDG